jgi:response regulator NasT
MDGAFLSVEGAMPAFDQSPEQIRVAVVTDTILAARHITRALRDSGYAVRPFSLTSPVAYDRVRDLRPAVVLLRVGSPDPGSAQAFHRLAISGGPALILLTPEASPQQLGLARESGAMVHLVEPVAAQTLAAAVWVSAARAKDLRELSAQLTDLRESFESRKVVERAKNVLMRRLELNEEEAHRRLQQESRNRNRKLVETAWHVIRADGHLSRADDVGAVAH